MNMSQIDDRKIRRQIGIVRKKISSERIRKIKRIAKALSCEIRLKILYALCHQDMCACALARLTGCSFSKCSYHLSMLKKAGLVDCEKKGNYIIYSITQYGKSIISSMDEQVIGKSW